MNNEPANPPAPPAAPSPNAPAGWLAFAWRLARLPLIAFLVVLLGMTFIERWLVYPAPSPSDGDWDPAAYEAQDVWFESADGTKLHGWYFSLDRPQRVVLYFHGNGEQVADNGELMQQIRDELQAAVLVFDYRGYGLSSGSPYEAGVIADGAAALAWLAKQTDRRPDQIVLIGRSIGGAVATAVAADQGAGALVLQSTFTKLTDAAAVHFPWLPVRWVIRNRFNSLARIAHYEGPLHASHGDSDAVVPFEQGRALFDASPSPTKRFLTLPGGDHNDPQPNSYYDDLAEFLSQAGV